MVKVFVPGVFDVFHIGHLNYLMRASEAGDHLVVGVQDDREVLRGKGAAPVVPLAERVAILEQLRFVDEVLSYVSVFQGPLLESLGVQVFAVGEEYGHDERFPDQITTLDYCKTHGIEVCRIPRTQGVSSTAVRSKLKEFWASRAGLIEELHAGVTVLGSFSGKQDQVQEQTRREVGLVLKAVPEASEKTLLDLGCGDGRQLVHLCRHFQEVTGVDYVEDLLKIAKDRLLKEEVQATLLESDAVSFQSNKSFDVVLLSGLFPCLDDAQANQLIKNLEEYTHEGSQLLVRTSIGVDRRINVINQYSAELSTEYTAYYRTHEEILHMFREHGWKLQEDCSLYQHRSDTGVWWYHFTPQAGTGMKSQSSSQKRAA